MSGTLLDKLLDPLARSFSKDQARQIMRWRLDAETQTRLERLRNGANEGTLSHEEEAEYRRWVEDLDVIAIIQAKARQSLAEDAA